MNKPTIYPLKKVVKLFCPKCRELMVKFYPTSPWSFKDGDAPACIKCVNKFNIEQAKKNIKN